MTFFRECSQSFIREYARMSNAMAAHGSLVNEFTKVRLFTLVKLVKKMVIQVLFIPSNSIFIQCSFKFRRLGARRRQREH